MITQAANKANAPCYNSAELGARAKQLLAIQEKQ